MNEILSFKLDAADGHAVNVRKWHDSSSEIRAVVQLVHGMAEHSERYDALAQTLVAEGYVVFGHDQRGHGYSVNDNEILGHVADHNGWQCLTDDVGRVNAEIKQQYSGVPVILLGHSMGSFVSLNYAQLYGNTIDALVLSGSTYRPPLLSTVLAKFIRFERWRCGPQGKSKVIAKAAFGTFNKAFAPNRTECDWLSRDPLQVDMYLADPLCGFECSTQFWLDMVTAQAKIFTAKNLKRLPVSLPCYVMSGELDPLQEVTGAARLQACLQAAGLRGVSLKTYSSARHELFNETNRDEVIDDLLAWFAKIQFVRPPSSARFTDSGESVEALNNEVPN